ncbi:hypothetical protein NRIC_36580 [Enterococcus florum]|uniref:Uncharacterized protein n=1 Tax=Enterococcus florum TaxID=2480627 RepID=A0A4P5PC37_9ENTE|nr:hypothetical protein [Enterococcus florum]GCF95767.1 hypothetical protein NRIC_36580 [Enterococcus florum]
MISINSLLVSLLILIAVLAAVGFWRIKSQKSVGSNSQGGPKVKDQAALFQLFEDSLAMMKEYRGKIKQQGYRYIKAGTPFVVQHLEGFQKQIAAEETNQDCMTVNRLLEKNIETLQDFAKKAATIEASGDQTERLKLQVLNYVNKTIIDWNRLAEDPANLFDQK